MTGTTTAIYEPPKEGLPYLVVTFTPDRMNVSTANSSTAAREIAAEHSIRRRKDKLIALAKGSLPGDRQTANEAEPYRPRESSERTERCYDRTAVSDTGRVTSDS